MYLVRGVGRLGDIDAIAAVSVKTTDAAPDARAIAMGVIFLVVALGISLCAQRRVVARGGTHVTTAVDAIDVVVDYVSHAGSVYHQLPIGSNRRFVITDCYPLVDPVYSFEIV